jgi:hypothetical protein
MTIFSFLNDTARVADPTYEPTDGQFCYAYPYYEFNNFSKADIVRARVRTYGVEEHKFILENGMMGTVSRISRHGITDNSSRRKSRL